MVAIATGGLALVLGKVVDYLKAHTDNIGLGFMWFVLFYIVAGAIVVLYYTGWLREHNCEWIVIALAIVTFPAIIYL